MKKQLPKDIMRYDDKMILKMNGETAKSAALALIPALIVGVPLTFVSVIIGATAGITVWAAALLLQLGRFGGVPAKDYLKHVLTFRAGKNRKFEYLHTGGERLDFDPQEPKDGKDSGNKGKNRITVKKDRTENDFRSGRTEKNAQGEIPFVEWHSNGIFRIDGKRVCIVCRFSNAGYLSKTESEQIRKYESYREALASLPAYIRYEETISNEPLDTEVYLDAIASGRDAPGLTDYEKSFFEVQEKFAVGIEREISHKRYTVTLSCEVADSENPYNKLFDAVNTLDARFRELGSKLEVLTPDEVFAELYKWYQPFGKEMPRIPANLYSKGLSVKDIIAPDGIKYEDDHIRLGEAFCRIYSIADYGEEVMDTLIYSLLNNDMPVSVSKHIEHIDKPTAVKSVQRRLEELEARRQSKLTKNKKNGTNYVPADLLDAIKGCEETLEALSGKEEFIRQTVYITVRAGDKDTLDEYCERIKTAALSAHCLIKAVRYYQRDAFKSVLPLGTDLITRHVFMFASLSAVITPFSYESVFDKNGFWYGKNEHSGEPFILNRKLGKSSHGFVFGRTGSGKGIFTKHEISNVLYQPYCSNDRIIIVDATGEYIPMAQAAGGKIYELESAGESHLNPLYISQSQRKLLGRSKATASKIEHLIALLSQLKQGDGLTATEKALADGIAGELLKKHSEQTLDDFYAALIKESSPDADTMRAWLKRYVEGSVTLFAGRDSGGEKDARMTVYSVRSLSGDLRNAGMLAMLERIESELMSNYEAGRWTWIYIDEMHRYFDTERNPYAAGRFARAYAEWRKYGAILTGITQLPLPVINSPDGSQMISNSRFVVMAELDGSNISAAADLYELNEDHRRTLAAPSLGQYVIRANNAPMSVRLLYPGANPDDKNMMYDLFNTAFEEKS